MQAEDISMRKQYLQFEDKWLAPYAQRTRDSKGREYPEPEHPNRTCYQRDRDRIIHSRAFRRMEYKTQVFIVHEGDHYRTRLTHTIEVATIARSIARVLRLNEDLTEAIALAHDTGHPPFGHSGEKALYDLMKDYGGFEHNSQSLRIVEELETRYPHFRGLNLTYEVREGIAKHKTAYDMPMPSRYNPGKMPLLEAQAADISDEIAYNTHDLDDGLESGLLNCKDLEPIALWQDSYSRTCRLYNSASGEIKKYYTVRSVIDVLVNDAVSSARENIKRYNINSPDSVRDAPSAVIRFSRDTEKKNSLLKDFLYNNLYTHYKVNRMNHKAYTVVSDLFRIYTGSPKLLSPSTRAKLKQYPLQRVVCDYIAGMTDRYALQEHSKLCGV